MVEILETIAESLEECPICESSDGFKISGFLGKTLECNNCKAKWSGGADPDGTQWLWLQKPSKTNVGNYLMKRNRPFALTFWLDKEKPFLKYERYAEAVFETFKDMENAPLEIGRAVFKGASVLLFGPAGGILAEIFPFPEGSHVTVAVVDYTGKLKEDEKGMNDFFCQFVVSQRLKRLSEQSGIEITPYAEKGKEIEKVEENLFWPFKERKVTIPEKIMPNLVRYGLIKPAS